MKTASMVFTIPSLGSKRAHFNVDQDGMATTRVSHRSMHHFVNLVQKGRIVLGKAPLFLVRVLLADGVALNKSIRSVSAICVERTATRAAPGWTQQASVLRVRPEDFRLLVRPPCKAVPPQGLNAQQMVALCRCMVSDPHFFSLLLPSSFSSF